MENGDGFLKIFERVDIETERFSPIGNGYFGFLQEIKVGLAVVAMVVLSLSLPVEGDPQI